MKVKSALTAVALAVVGLLGSAGAANASCVKNPLSCANNAACTAAARAGLQCVD